MFRTAVRGERMGLTRHKRTPAVSPGAIRAVMVVAAGVATRVILRPFWTP